MEIFNGPLEDMTPLKIVEIGLLIAEHKVMEDGADYLEEAEKIWHDRPGSEQAYAECTRQADFCAALASALRNVRLKLKGVSLNGKSKNTRSNREPDGNT